MDLSFSRFERVAPVDPTAAEVAAATAVARSTAASDRTGDAPLRSRDGAFNGRMAAALTRWKEE